MQLLRIGALMAFLVLCLVGCDCSQIVKGVVLDKYTKLPIQGVDVKKIYRSEQSNYYQTRYLSDSLGRFAVQYMVGGALTCPDFQLSFSKPRYIAQTKTYSSITSNDTTYLEKMK